MGSVISAINDTVSISVFNRGLAGKVFEDVKKSGAKVVMKNNTAECVLISPCDYVALMEEVNEARLITMTIERMSLNSDKTGISFDELNRILGINNSDLDNFNEVEFE